MFQEDTEVGSGSNSSQYLALTLRQTSIRSFEPANEGVVTAQVGYGVDRRQIAAKVAPFVIIGLAGMAVERR